MPPVGFEPKISAGKQPKTYALDHAATGRGNNFLYLFYIIITFNSTTIVIILNGNFIDVYEISLKTKKHGIVYCMVTL
jgi:hypothetical protein